MSVKGKQERERERDAKQANSRLAESEKQMAQAKIVIEQIKKEAKQLFPQSSLASLQRDTIEETPAKDKQIFVLLESPPHLLCC